jgi:hypothetical protein
MLVSACFQNRVIRGVNLRESPSNVIISGQSLHTLLQTGKVTWGHHSAPVSWGARSRQWSGNLVLSSSVKEWEWFSTLEAGRVCSSQSQLTRLDVLKTHTLPVQEIRKSLSAVTLIDALTPSLAGKFKHVIGELVNGLVDTLHPTVDNVNTIVGRVLNQLLHVATETGKIGCDRWNTHDSTFCWRVTPWLIVGSENSQMRATNKVVVIQWEDWVGRVQELGVEDNLDSVRGMVEELNTADLIKDRIVVIVDLKLLAGNLKASCN